MPVYKIERQFEDGDVTEILVADTEKPLHPDYLKKCDVQTLAMVQSKLADDIATLKEISTHLQKQFDLIRLGILPEKMDEENITNITVTGVGRVTIQSDIYFSIPATAKEDSYKWLKNNGHGDLIQETVNSSSGKAWAKEMIKKGLPLPEDLFKVTPFSRAQITRK